MSLKKSRFLLISCILVALALSTQCATAQVATPPDSSVATDTLSRYYDMSIVELENLRASGVSSELEKLINSIVGVASKKSLSARESPSIVSLITEEDIRKSGARDLIDLLRQVPGFDFALQSEGVIGVGIRGNWAHEGKVLMMIDGQEMNEIFSATLAFGNHYPIENIQRIEIIRGPGSAIYGGFAEFGVINVVTKKADLNGVSIATVMGQMKDTYGRQNVQISAGKKLGNWELDASWLVGQGNRSDGRAYSFLVGGGGTSNIDSLARVVNLKNTSAINPNNLNVGIKYKGFSFRNIFDTYTIDDPTSTNKQGGRLITQKGSSWYSELKYEDKITDKLTITPRVNIIIQNPSITSTDKNFPIPNTRYVSRIKGNLSASYDYSRKLNFVFGGEYFVDAAVEENSKGDFIDSTEVQYENLAVFGQATYKTRLANIVLGARYDKNVRYGSAFVPRLGITKRIKRLNFKALYSQAFRAPTIENTKLAFNNKYDTISMGGNNFIIPIIGKNKLKPERTTVIELEFGYQLTRDMFLTANVFDITTRNVIVKYAPSFGQNVYSNFSKTGSRGIELEYKVRQKWGYVNLNYAYYNTVGKDRIDAYAIRRIDDTNSSDPENWQFVGVESKNKVLGFPSHKINLNASFNITKQLSVNPSATYNSMRYAYDVVIDAQNNAYPQIKKFDPVTLVNLNVRYENIFKGFDMSLGVYDLFNQQFLFVQPYFGLNIPMPGPSREFVLKAVYTLHGKK